MSDYPALPSALTQEVLAYFNVTSAAPTFDLLQRLIAAYVRRVPWESWSRIARRAVVAETADCPRWPELFWREAIAFGTGGTCFESNYAFMALLVALGYEGYLTVNDMGESVGVHSAIILHNNGVPWLVDVGLPLFVPLPIDPSQPTTTPSEFFAYTVRPIEAGKYQIERPPHPRPIGFTLIDQPLDNTAYRARTTADYGEGGLFLDVAVINKLVEERIWRFNSGEPPYVLQEFQGEQRIDYPIEGSVPEAVSAHFGIAPDITCAAWTVLQERD